MRLDDKNIIISYRLIKIVLLIFFLIVVLILLSHKLFAREDREELTVQKEIPTTTLIPSPTLVEISRKITMDEMKWKTYELVTLGVTFKLPPELSEYIYGIEERIYPGDTGHGYDVKFHNQSTADFSVGTNTADYSAGREATFTDLGAFIKKGNDYYALLVEGANADDTLIPKKIVQKEFINSNGIQILMLKGGKAYDNDTPYNTFFGLAEGSYGALINLNDKKFRGLTVKIKETEVITEEVFETILSTFKYSQ